MAERNGRRGETLCWTCKRACGGCSWSARDPVTDELLFQPVKGWVAVETSLYYDTGKRMGSYHVIWCPLCVPEEKRVLTRFERYRDELVRLEAMGLTGSQIARKLGVSRRSAGEWKKMLRGGNQWTIKAATPASILRN